MGLSRKVNRDGGVSYFQTTPNVGPPELRGLPTIDGVKLTFLWKMDYIYIY